jgi:hypothetical protein
VFLIVLILKYLILRLLLLPSLSYLSLPCCAAYFADLVAGFTLGEGDAVAGDGLAAGLGLVVAGVAVSPAGEDVAGDVVLAGEFVFVAGSQAATNAIARIVVSKSMMRLVRLVFGLLISFASLEQD